MPPHSDIVKVAIEWPGANAQLIEIDQVSARLKTPLKDKTYQHERRSRAVDYLLGIDERCRFNM